MSDQTLDSPVEVAAERTYARSARAALDAAKAREGVSPDGLYDVQVAAWGGAWVQLRRLSFNQIAAANTAAKGDEALLTRALLRQSFVQPPFSAGEVDEILDDPDQLDAAIELNLAVAQINKMTKAAQQLAAATFRAGAEV